MSDVILDIKQWGNSLGVRLPVAIARAAHLHLDQRVRMTVHNGQVIISPEPDATPTMEQRLARFDPARHGGEVMADTARLGAERW
jgi:antitoxin MazE